MTDPQSEKERNARRQGAAYQAAVEAVFAILIAAIIGYWLDGRLGTEPFGLLVGVVLGFTAFVLRLLRLGQRLREEEAGGGTPGNGDPR